MHVCPCEGCNQIVPNALWGWRAHWHALPNNIRAWIGRAYRIGMDHGTHPTKSYVAAHHAALEWMHEHEAGCKCGVYCQDTGEQCRYHEGAREATQHEAYPCDDEQHAQVP